MKKQDAYDLLLAESRKVGRPLTFDEVKRSPMLEEPNTYAWWYGSFSEVQQMVKDDLRLEAEGRLGASDADSPRPPGAYSSALAASKGFDRGHIKYAATKHGVKAARKVKEPEKGVVTLNKEEMLERLVELYRRFGYDAKRISEKNIKQDPVLIYDQVLQAFGSLHNARHETVRAYKQAQREGRDTSRISEDTGDSPVTEAADAPAPEAPAEETKKRKGGRKPVTEAEALEELDRLAEEFGKIPSADIINELSEQKKAHRYSTYRRALGLREEWDQKLEMYRAAKWAANGGPEQALDEAAASLAAALADSAADASPSSEPVAQAGSSMGAQNAPQEPSPPHPQPITDSVSPVADVPRQVQEDGEASAPPSTPQAVEIVIRVIVEVKQ